MAHSEKVAFMPEYRECETHGRYQASFHDGEIERFIGDCPKCSHARAVDRLMDRAAIPPRFKAKTFENFDTSDQADANAHRVALEYANNFDEVLSLGRCLILVGVPGTGKTHIACAIANQIIATGFSALFSSVGTLIKKLRSTWSRDSQKTEIEMLNEIASVDLLIIDEVGVQYGSESEEVQIFEVINRRYEEMKPTIIISNLPVASEDGKSLKDYLGERSFDRLRENGGKLIQFTGKSKRR